MRLIISADFHLRDDKPRCRLDEDWFVTQEKAINELVSIANNKKASLCGVGDIFDTPVVSARLFEMFLSSIFKLNKDFYVIFGNHDLPYHSMANIKNSYCGIIMAMIEAEGKIKFPDFASYNNFNSDIIENDPSIVFTHRLVFKSPSDMPPNVNAITASELLKEYPKAKYIFTGDMHKAFHYENKGRHVINPGCILRQEADFIDYKPSVYFIDTDKEEIEQIFLSDSVEMVTDEYLKREKEKEDRIDAFVEMVKVGEGFTLNFIDNIKKSIRKNRKTLKETTIDVIQSLVGIEEGE